VGRCRKRFAKTCCCGSAESRVRFKTRNISTSFRKSDSRL
jgi:hypothetical protein